jgi:hypothetical protein
MVLAVFVAQPLCLYDKGFGPDICHLFSKYQSVPTGNAAAMV